MFFSFFSHILDIVWNELAFFIKFTKALPLFRFFLHFVFRIIFPRLDWPLQPFYVFLLQFVRCLARSSRLHVRLL